MDISPAAAGRAIAAQFPDLADADVQPFGSGWDNTAFLVGGDVVFRFVRREFARQFVETETRFLGALTGRLPLAIPEPTFVGTACPDAPLGFAGYRLLPGRTGCWAALDEDDRARAAAPLGTFLAALHATELRACDGAELPGDTIARHDVRGRAPACIERLSHEGEYLGDALVDRALAATTALRDAPPWDGHPVTCHGDLYGRHVLFDDDHQPCGVIDWGDLHRGDPAVDLGIAYSFLPAHARPAFFAAYGDVDAGTRARARYRAFHYASFLMPYGRETGDEGMLRLGRLALTYGLEDGAR